MVLILALADRRLFLASGDFNGDGMSDLLIERQDSSGGHSFAGASYVLFGQLASFGASFSLSSLDGANGFVINGVNTL